MFSRVEKELLASIIQKALRETGNAELPEGEINFLLHVDGKEGWSWANICNKRVCEIPVPKELRQNMTIEDEWS